MSDRFEEQVLVEVMAGWMKVKLAANRHKPPWNETHLNNLLIGLQAEVEELGRAVDNGESVAAIWAEAADVANFAAMVAAAAAYQRMQNREATGVHPDEHDDGPDFLWAEGFDDMPDYSVVKVTKESMFEEPSDDDEEAPVPKLRRRR